MLAAFAAVYIVWVVLSVLTVPLYMLANKELAPSEDQGVVFGFVQSDANATIDQRSFYADEVNKLLMAVPEKETIRSVSKPALRRLRRT